MGLEKYKGLLAGAKAIVAEMDRNRQMKETQAQDYEKAMLGAYAKSAFPSELEKSQTGLFKAYSKQLLGGAQDETGLPDMEFGGMNVKGMKFAPPAKLTPYQQMQEAEKQKETGATQRYFSAWLQGNPLPPERAGQEPIPSPQTQEEAHWGLMQMGEDPSQYDFSNLPSQTKLYGKPAGGGKGAAKGIMRIFPGYTKHGAFKPEIPKFTGQPAVAPAAPQHYLERHTPAAPQASMLNPQIQQRIEEARAQGIPDEKIAADLKAVGIDPRIYGLR